MSTVLNPKGDRVYHAGATPRAWVNTYLNSSVGQKFTVALTGLALSGFLVGHMVGNLKMFSGQDSINKYAYFLKHDLGILIWVARIGLIALFSAHLFLTIRLKLRARAARQVPYFFNRVAQATISSRTMIYSGLTVGLFLAFHLAHYTFGWVHDVVQPDGTRINYLQLPYEVGKQTDGTPKVYHDVYNMVIAGFSTHYISALYVVAQLVLFLHLSHGIQSSLQTLGLVGRRFTPAAKALGYFLSAVIVAGNLSVVVAVWTGYLPPILPGGMVIPQPAF